MVGQSWRCVGPCWLSRKAASRMRTTRWRLNLRSVDESRWTTSASDTATPNCAFNSDSSLAVKAPITSSSPSSVQRWALCWRFAVDIQVQVAGQVG